MDSSLFQSKIERASGDQLREALRIIFRTHASPIFGAARVIEHEIAALRALQHLQCLPTQPDEYELVMALRVTRAKARSLLYQAALRSKPSQEENDAALKQLLSQPRVCMDGEKILLEVADPLLMDCLRQRIRRLGFISDGTFSGSLAKLPLAALAALIEDLLSAEQKTRAQQLLRRQGAPGDDLRSLIISVFSHYGHRFAGPAGEKVVQRIGDKVADFFADNRERLFDWVEGS